MSAPRPDAETLLAEWLERLDAEEGGDFADLVRRHPEHEAELKRLYGYWRKLQAIDRRVAPEDLEPDGGRRSSEPFRGPRSLGAGGAGLERGARLGQFEMVEELGRGGMGVVWKAHDLMLGEEVALKFLPHVLAADRLSMLRLRREAKVLLSLTHLHIVRLRTVAVKHGLTFLVEECLAGPTLEMLVHDRIEAGARGLAADEALWVLGEIAPALDYAHGEGVTHRDLKPSNLMLDAVPGGGLGEGSERVKLTDFGLAFVATSALTQLSGYRPSGTLPFMAPEVLIGRKPTPAADLYSLGATLYALVSGRPPFTHGDVATQVLHRAPDPLESGDANLDAAVAAAMAKNPADRPGTAAELIAIARGERRAPGRLPRVRLAAGAALLAAVVASAPWWSDSRPDDADAAPEPIVRVQPEDEHEPASSADARIVLDAPFDGADGERVFVDEKAGGLVLRGRVVDARNTALVVRVDSLRLQVELDEAGAFVVSTPLVPARVYTVRTEAGGAPERTFEVVLDDAPPALALLAPEAADTKTDAPTCVLRVRVDEPHPASVLMRANEAQPRALRDAGTGVWESDELPLAPGANTFWIVATDRAGHRAELAVVVRRATGGPTLASTDPAPESTVAFGEPLTMSLSFTTPITAARLDGAEMTLTDGGLGARVERVAPSRPGPWHPRWSAVDATGAETASELEYTVALVPRIVRCGGRELETVGPNTDDVGAAGVGWARWPTRVRDPASGLVFRLIEPGAFLRGSPPRSGRFDEEPRREVRITRAFYLAETETTLAQWRRFVLASTYRTSAEDRGASITRSAADAGWQEAPATWQEPVPEHSFGRDGRHPVTQVSWIDARAFCEHFGYRLPSEAEWSYACRAGAPGTYPWGDLPARARGAGNFGDESAAAVLAGLAALPFDDGHPFTAPVASYAPNAFGLFDMLGNVWEWCADGYDPAAYETAALADPLAPAAADQPRVLRGGSWLSGADGIRLERRAWDSPDRASDTRGFRACFTP